MGSADTQTPGPPTPLYVIIPPSPLFAAHWSLYLPDLLAYDTKTRRHEESKDGRRIHVSGDRLNGFHLEIVRQYNIRKHRSVGTRLFAIGLVPHDSLNPKAQSQDTRDDDAQRFQAKDEDEGGGYIDNRPIDAFERLCVEVEAPGPSLHHVSGNSAESRGKRKIMEVRDCQWWVRQVVYALVDKGMLISRSESDQETDIAGILETLPVH